jgi:[ribosomal protein S5]-alanine N-acetyltransferase
VSQQLIESFLSSPVDDLSLVLETDRLLLEPITTDHVEKMLTILCDEALYQYIPQNPPNSVSLKQTYGFWQNRKSPDSKEIWLNWAAKLKTTNEYIGHFQAGWDSKNGFSVAYTVGIQFQKQGFAKEAVSSVIDFLVSHFDAETLRAWIDTRNLASINLMKSLGFTQSDFIENADEFKGSKSDEFIFELKVDLLDEEIKNCALNKFDDKLIQQFIQTYTSISSDSPVQDYFLHLSTDQGEELEIGFFNSSIIGDVTLSNGKVYNYSFPLSEIKEVKIVDLDSKIVLQIQGTKKLDYNIVKPGSITKLESYKNSLLNTLSGLDLKVNQ